MVGNFQLKGTVMGMLSFALLCIVWVFEAEIKAYLNSASASHKAQAAYYKAKKEKETGS